MSIVQRAVVLSDGNQPAGFEDLGGGPTPPPTTPTSIENGGSSVSIDEFGNVTGTIVSGAGLLLQHADGSVIEITGAGNINLQGAGSTESVEIAPGSYARLVSGDNRVVVDALSGALMRSDNLTVEVMNNGELQINGAPGGAGQRLTSNGAGIPPTWAA